MTSTLKCWLCLLALIACGQVRGQIVLDADFDHGGLDEANSMASDSFVTLAGRDNFNPGDWKWLYFSADNVNGLTPVFQIDDDFAGGGANLNNHAMVYSYDQQTWQFFDNNDRNAGADTFTFSNNGAFSQDKVFVAYGLPYSFGRAQSHVAQVAASPWVSPTMSGDSSLVIGQSPGGTDDIGRSIAPRDIYGYKITDASSSVSKQKIALLGGVHSNETVGNYTLEGMIDFLVGDSFEAAQLRKQAEFYVYPMANPDGRFAGYNRSTVQRVTQDPNRFWDSPLYGLMSDIKVVGDALLADTGGDVDYFIDFHSTVSGKDGHFAFVLPDFQDDPFWQNLLQRDTSLSTRDASLVNLTAAKFGRDELNAEFSITFETQFIADENIDRFHDLGADMGLAFADVFRVFADLNFDSQLDGQDWQLFIAGAETDLSGLTAIEAYQAGDLDGDGVNSIADFGLFRDAFIATHGLAGFQALLNPVPEPSTCLILLTTLVGFSRRSFIRASSLLAIGEFHDAQYSSW